MINSLSFHHPICDLKQPLEKKHGLTINIVVERTYKKFDVGNVELDLYMIIPVGVKEQSSWS